MLRCGIRGERRDNAGTTKAFSVVSDSIEVMISRARVWDSARVMCASREQAREGPGGQMQRLHDEATFQVVPIYHTYQQESEGKNVISS